jgi:pantoate--beta-alanine ligase
MMQVVRSIAECRRARDSLGKLAFVPTMGALHDGHLSLVASAARLADTVAVSIFVNPTQFGPKEDFNRYPRPIEDDLAMCRRAGVKLVFAPEPAEMYPDRTPAIHIDFPALTSVLDGICRPGHFPGVCQVVAKLFNIVQPQVACFGEKDFQQLAVLKAMVAALDFPIRVVGCPTLRDDDGMAMSSRNRYLSADERLRGLSISRGLKMIRQLAVAGETDATSLRKILARELIAAEPQSVPVSIDYATIVDRDTLQELETLHRPARALVAMRVGSTRLIDNIALD